MKRLLIVEDDNHINSMISDSFSKSGYECVSAYSGTEAMLHIENEKYDLIILDLMLPGISGQEVLKRTRALNEIPVIVLSAKDELDSKVDLLTMGANDYITKPFELKELEARVLVQLRNSKNEPDKNNSLEYKELKLDLDKKVFTVGNHQVMLTAQEQRIIELLLRYPGKVFSKNEIYEYAWDDYYMGEDKTINVHVSNIRQKLKKVSDNEYIETVWGLGFKL